MLNFFQAIFTKVVSVVASVIIAVGIVHVPPIPDLPMVVENEPQVAGVVEDQASNNTDKEIEKLKKEIEALKNKPTPAPVVRNQPIPPPAPTPAPAPVQAPPPVAAPVQVPVPKPQVDSSLKIAQCQATARAQVDTELNKAYLATEALTKDVIAKYDAQIKSLQDANYEYYQSELNQPGTGGLTPADYLESLERAAHIYDGAIAQYEAKKREINLMLQQTKEQMKKAGEQSYNRLYLTCLNS